MTRTRPQTEGGYRSLTFLLGLLLVLVFGCDSGDQINSPGTEPSPGTKAELATAFTGIPFGTFAQVKFNSTYTGGLINPEFPESLLIRLARVKAGHGRVVVYLPGTANKYTNSDGSFNFTLWKSRLARFKSVDQTKFKAYVTDGTVFGNYLMDQPNCTACWGGKAISQATVEAMAKYSKTVYPFLPTVIRADATWLKGYTGTYVYLDATWAQYVMRKGTVQDYFTSNLAAAKALGLRMMAGLNLIDGGPNRASLTATQIKTFGAYMLADPYPCSFISWADEADERDAFLKQTDIAAAMVYLGQKAAAHPVSSCK